MHHSISIKLWTRRSIGDYHWTSIALPPELDGLEVLEPEELREHDARRAGKSISVQPAKDAEHDAPGRRFRSAGETLSRLRWDPAHRFRDYDVGYLDRFDGLKWLPSCRRCARRLRSPPPPQARSLLWLSGYTRARLSRGAAVPRVPRGKVSQEGERGGGHSPDVRPSPLCLPYYEYLDCLARVHIFYC